jgi:hypothetical protein
VAGEQPALADRRFRRDRAAAPGVTALLPSLGEIFRGRERQTLLAHADEVADPGRAAGARRRMPPM